MVVVPEIRRQSLFLADYSGIVQFPDVTFQGILSRLGVCF